MITRLGQTIQQKRIEAGLSILQLALLSGLSVLRLHEIEHGGGEPVSFDLCRALGQVLSARTGHQFVLQELWLAYSVDKYFQSKFGI